MVSLFVDGTASGVMSFVITSGVMSFVIEEGLGAEPLVLYAEVVQAGDWDGLTWGHSLLHLKELLAGLCSPRLHT